MQNAYENLHVIILNTLECSLTEEQTDKRSKSQSATKKNPLQPDFCWVYFYFRIQHLRHFVHFKRAFRIPNGSGLSAPEKFTAILLFKASR